MGRKKLNKLELVRTWAFRKSKINIYVCLFCFLFLHFVIVSKLSSPNCCVGNFFQPTIVPSNTLRCYIALLTTRREISWSFLTKSWGLEKNIELCCLFWFVGTIFFFNPQLMLVFDISCFFWTVTLAEESGCSERIFGGQTKIF